MARTCTLLGRLTWQLNFVHGGAVWRRSKATRKKKKRRTAFRRTISLNSWAGFIFFHVFWQNITIFRGLITLLGIVQSIVMWLPHEVSNIIIRAQDSLLIMFSVGKHYLLKWKNSKFFTRAARSRSNVQVEQIYRGKTAEPEIKISTFRPHKVTLNQLKYQVLKACKATCPCCTIYHSYALISYSQHWMERCNFFKII